MSAATAPPASPGARRRSAAGAGAALRRLGGLMLVASPTLYVVLLLIVPVGFIAAYSFNLSSNVVGQPVGFSTDNWEAFLFGDGNPFRERFFRSLLVTLAVSVVAVIGAYPLAYFLAFVAGRRRYTILLLILAPFFTSYLLRVVAWQVTLNNNGVVNSLLWELGLREDGNAISWLIYSNFSVGLVLFYAWVPFVALPIFVVLDSMDRNLLAAAQDLGANKLQTFLRVTLPLSLPGVASGFVFVLIPTTGEFIAPLLVGGAESQLFGNSIQTFFGETPNWNYGAVLALALVATVLILLALFGRFLVPGERKEVA